MPASGLKVNSSGGRGIFSFTARRDVKAVVKVKLKGKAAWSGDASHCNPYNKRYKQCRARANGWRTIDQTSATRLEGAGTHRIHTSPVDLSRCRHYTHCKLNVTGLIFTRATAGGQWYKSKWPATATNTRRLK
jgi:hypothetical protein